MFRVLASALACAAVVSAAAQAPDRPAIAPGKPYTYEFAGEHPVVRTLDARGTALIRVRNLGRDSVLTISSGSGERLLRAAGWRGPEHYYFAIVDLEAPVVVSLAPDDPISPPGQVEVMVEILPPGSQRATAERFMTRAADRNLAYYYGESDTREIALKNYRAAADLFAGAGYKARHADALFEAANVNDVLCRRSMAHQQLEEAESVWRELGDERSIAAAENHRGLLHWATGNGSASMDLFDMAAKRRERLGDDYYYAEAINNLGLVHRERGDAQLAVQYFLGAIRIWQGNADVLNDDIDVDKWRELDRPPSMHHTLTGLNNLGYANEIFGDVVETEAIWRRALTLTDHLSNNFTASTLRNNLGNLERKSGDMEEAMRLLDAALRFFTEESPDDFWAAAVHFNIGQLHRDLGDTTRALQSFERSLVLQTPDCDPVGRAETLKEIAAIEVAAGRIGNVLDKIRQGKELLRPYPGNKAAEARLHELHGRALLISGDTDAAIEEFDAAIRRYRSAGDRYGELTARTHRARANSGIGRHFAAIPELHTALGLARQVDSRLEQFRVQAALGEMHLANSDPVAALSAARDAIELSEAVRERLVLPVLLRDFASVQRAAYDVLVRAHLELGKIEDAWIASDAGRARRFSDVIRQSEIDFSLLTHEERERYGFLLGAVAQRAEARTRLIVRDETESADAVLEELLPLIDELDHLQQKARRPGAQQDLQPDLSTLQQTLGDGDVILEYHIGPSVAGLWSISKDKISFSEIARPVSLIDDVDAIRSAFSQRRPELAERLNEIARKILVSELLESRGPGNLIVIPDGPLHYLPFSALPDPAGDWREPLVAKRTVSYLPSVRALAELRRRKADAGEGIAILADPIFQASDPRVKQGVDENLENTIVAFLGNEMLRSSMSTGVAELPRLPGTMTEARAIEAAAGDVEILPLYGADANREAVLSGRLKRYGILHFATHGILDDVEPALSGMVLSGVTLDGAERDSFLRSQDIVGLDIDAKLVVLSGCETALGRPVHGEGLVGLSRAFFYAGARQVVSTLWQIPDEASAKLMEHFYRALLQQSMSTAAALRSAQVTLRSDPRWSNPYYWAPFILQGDWH